MLCASCATCIALHTVYKGKQIYLYTILQVHHQSNIQIYKEKVSTLHVVLSIRYTALFLIYNTTQIVTVKDFSPVNVKMYVWSPSDLPDKISQVSKFRCQGQTSALTPVEQENKQHLPFPQPHSTSCHTSINAVLPIDIRRRRIDCGEVCLKRCHLGTGLAQAVVHVYLWR